MEFRYKLYVLFPLLLIVSGVVKGQSTVSFAEQFVVGDTAIFRFALGDSLFRDNYKGNREAIAYLSHSIRTCRNEIESGRVKIRVKGFWDAEPSRGTNMLVAKDHSNQIKSYFIVMDSVKESHFRTANYVKRWNGQQDVVAIAYLCRTAGEKIETTPISESEEKLELYSISGTASQPQSDPVSEKADIPEPEPEQSPVSSSAGEANDELSKPDVARNRWAIKTNVAYLAATVANLGVEYSFGKRYSLDLPIIYSPYTVSRSYCLRFLAVQPELRYWMEDPMKGHFFGVHFNIGAFNISVDKENRYQSADGFYGAGISYGYVLPFAGHWAAEFTLGAGYVYTKYDVYYNISNGACYKKGVLHDYWGLTKVGVNLVYRFGK